MEALLRLRVLIWILVLGLWGVLVYQFLGEEEAQQMQYVHNPYRGPSKPTPSQHPPDSQPMMPERAVEPAEGTGPSPAPPRSPPHAAPRENRRSSLDYLNPINIPRPARGQRTAPPIRHETGLGRPDPPIPAGFVKSVTPHFNIYAENSAASEEFERVLENLHANLMLDLAAFSPWASAQRASIFLFKNQDTYRRVTGRPAWSGGASSVPKRRVYVYESDELTGILAHELCHIYYDGFFLEGQPNPLWLSEGMATLVQVERGLSAPNWLRENMETLEQGGGYSMEDLMGVGTTAGAADDKIRLWYAQAYSTVRFLIRSQYKSSFYKFSLHLREGRGATQALYRAYGMPYNRLKALEYAWRYELTSNSLLRLAPAEK